MQRQMSTLEKPTLNSRVERLLAWAGARGTHVGTAHPCFRDGLVGQMTSL